MDRLNAVIQHYAWGDHDFLAALQRRPPSGQPEAELWMGAHPRGASRLASTGLALDSAIAADPVGSLGAGAAGAFGALPFLAKVLASDQPLSIQSHPSAAQARAGFDDEDARGIPIDAPDRVYRDPHHKPELICALTPFVAKCGFRELTRTRELFTQLDDPGLDDVRSHLAMPGADADVLADVLAWLLRLSAADASSIAAATVAACARLTSGPYAPDAAWTATIAALHPGDIGVTVALLLNHVVLQPGEAIFLRAGNLHAYLRGAGIELMANSDNVVRGGLTPKHIDVEELLRVVDCMPLDAPVQRPAGAEHTYDSPVSEFSLTRVEVTERYGATVEGPEIVIATEGSFVLENAAGHTVEIATGEPVWIPARDDAYEVRGTGLLFRARVGPDSTRSS